MNFHVLELCLPYLPAHDVLRMSLMCRDAHARLLDRAAVNDALFMRFITCVAPPAQWAEPRRISMRQLVALLVRAPDRRRLFDLLLRYGPAYEICWCSGACHWTSCYRAYLDLAGWHAEYDYQRLLRELVERYDDYVKHNLP